MGSSIGRGFTSAKNFVGRGISGAGRMLGGAKDFAGRQLGRVGRFATKGLKGVPLLSAAVPVIDELMAEDGSLGRGLFRAGGSFLGGLGAGAVGTAATSFAGGIGGIPAAITGGVYGDQKAGQFYDYLFGGSDSASAPPANTADAEANSDRTPADITLLNPLVHDRVMDELLNGNDYQRTTNEILEDIYMQGQGTFTGSAGSDMEFETGLTNR